MVLLRCWDLAEYMSVGQREVLMPVGESASPVADRQQGTSHRDETDFAGPYPSSGAPR